MSFIKRITPLIFYLSLLLWIITAYLREQLPDRNQILPSLLVQPSALAVTKSPFKITTHDITYTIEPQYNYELHGLIVSSHDASGIDDYYHERAKDYINPKDICVAFGDNLRSDIYKRVKFSSGSWTCYYQLTTYADQNEFKAASYSNNHLVTIDPELINRIKSTHKGDQIYLKGYIVKYWHDNNPPRGYDSFRLGAGECQVIYLNDFEILKENPWKLFYALSKWATILSGILWIIRHFFFDPII